jgi:hypothetical protein
MNKFWIVVNGIVAIGAFIIVIAMVFFDYTPSRSTVIVSIIIVMLGAINEMVDYRTKYWQEQLAKAKRERNELMS